MDLGLEEHGEEKATADIPVSYGMLIVAVFRLLVLICLRRQDLRRTRYCPKAHHALNA